MSDRSLRAIEEILPARGIPDHSLAHPFSGVLFCAEHRVVSVGKTQSATWLLTHRLQVAVAHCIFFLLAVFLMQHSIRLPCGPARGRSSGSSCLFHSCFFPSTCHGFLVLVLFFLLPSRSLEKELLVMLKIERAVTC